MGQVQVITGVERRRRWSIEQKRAIVAAAFAPGAVVSEVARRADVYSNLIYRWRQELRSKAAVFAEVVVAATTPSSMSQAEDAVEVASPSFASSAPPPLLDEKPIVIASESRSDPAHRPVGLLRPRARNDPLFLPSASEAIQQPGGWTGLLRWRSQ